MTTPAGGNVYKYVATDLITGRVLSDSVPLTVTSFSRQLNTYGVLTGTLSLRTDDEVKAPYVGALECTRAVLWVLQNGFPVWCGIVWDWPHSSITPPAVLPISAQSIESLFDHRLITGSLSYPSVDIFDVFRDLVTYGTSKNSPYITSGSPPANRLPAVATDAMAVAGLNLPAGRAGVTWSGSYAYSDYRKISDVWQDLLASGNFEYTFEPGLNADGTLGFYIRLGYTTLGRPAANSGLVFAFPGNVIDYAYPRSGSRTANAIWATAPPNGATIQWQSAYPHGFDLTALRNGYPLLEDTEAWNGSVVTSQAQVNQFADGRLQYRAGTMALPQLVVGGAGQPALPEITLGDEAWFAATSPLHPSVDGKTPGLVVQVRLAGWTLTPPAAGQPEKLTISTSSVVVNA